MAISLVNATYSYNIIYGGGMSWLAKWLEQYFPYLGILTNSSHEVYISDNITGRLSDTKSECRWNHKYHLLIPLSTIPEILIIINRGLLIIFQVSELGKSGCWEYIYKRRIREFA